MEIAYAAHTESCTFLLDGDGICRFVTAPSARRTLPPGPAHARRPAQATGNGGDGGHGAHVPDHADRCIGAQYVASLDLGARGGLVDLPQPGAPLLFARIEPDGRIALVRSGPLVRFEPLSAGGSGVRARPQPASARPQPAAPPAASRTSRPAVAMPPSKAPIARPTAPSVAADEERTSPYRPSNATIAASLRAPSVAPRPSRIEEAPRATPLPRLPGPPRLPQGVAQPVTPLAIPRVASGIARLPVPHPTRTPPPPASSAPTRPRRPSVIRAGVTPPRDTMQTIEPDGEDAITVPQRRAR